MGGIRPSRRRVEADGHESEGRSEATATQVLRGKSPSHVFDTVPGEED